MPNDFSSTSALDELFAVDAILLPSAVCLDEIGADAYAGPGEDRFLLRIFVTLGIESSRKAKLSKLHCLHEQLMHCLECVQRACLTVSQPD